MMRYPRKLTVNSRTHYHSGTPENTEEKGLGPLLTASKTVVLPLHYSSLVA